MNSRLRALATQGWRELLARLVYRIRRVLVGASQATYAEWIRRVEPATTRPGVISGVFQLDMDGHTEDAGWSGWSWGSDLPGTLRYLAVLRGGTVHRAVMGRVADAIDAREPALLFGDYDHLDNDGRRVDPQFLPGWDPELLLEHDYVGPLFLLRRDMVETLLAQPLPEAAPTYALLLRCARAIPESDVARCPHILSHRTGAWPESMAARRFTLEQWRLPADGTLVTEDHAGWPRVQWLARIESSVPVSIVIPTRDRADLLKACLDSIDATVGDVAELVLVDNGSSDPAALALIEQRRLAGATVVTVDRPFNFSDLVNAGVRAARGSVLCLLNNDVRAVREGWLGELVAIARRPEVGAVGPMLVYPAGPVQQAGIVLDGAAGPRHVGAGLAPSDSRLRFRRQFSAITGACMAFRREVFDQVGGFDEAFPVAFNDVDYCLRVRSKGLRIVWTPDAVLEHVESATRGADVAPERHARAIAALGRLRQRWSRVLDDDPFYNPNFAVGGEMGRLSLLPRLETLPLVNS